MKSYQSDFIEPSIFDKKTISCWFTKVGESVQQDTIIEGLNLGFNTDEDVEVVKENRKFLANSISTALSNIAFASQVHGTEILEVTKGGIYTDIDGFITKTRGLALAIQVADCAAVLFADSNAGIISAVHAGWRGAEANIVPKAIQEMISLGANLKDIRVFISPCISQENFELGEEVARKFPEKFIDRVNYSKPHLDLKAFIDEQILDSGIDKSNIEIEDSCTFSDTAYYSYRRNGSKAGRMMGIIKINTAV